MSRGLRVAVVVQSSLYAGLTPHIYAAPLAIGSGDGSSEANAMSLTTAKATATAGTIVGCLPGSTGSYIGADLSSNQTPSHHPTNSGTLGSQITFVAKYPAAYLGGTLALLRSDPATYVAAVAAHSNRSQLSNGVTSWVGTPGQNGCPVIGSSGKNYIRWIGFYIDGATSYSHADTGPTIFAGCTGCELHQNVIIGWEANYTDIFAGLNLRSAYDAVIKNNIIRTFWIVGSDNHNQAGFLSYGAVNVTMEHNDFSDMHTAIFTKSRDVTTMLIGNSGVIRYNRMRDVDQGIDLNATHPASTQAVSFNLVYDYRFAAYRMGVNPGPADSWFGYELTNNTAARPSAAGTIGLYVQALTIGGYRVVDNLLVSENAANGYHSVEGLEFTGSNGLFDAFTGNHYQRDGAERYGWNGSVYTALADFQTASGSSTGSTGDPLFTNSASGDFTLQGGSPAAGKGCYVTGAEEIGLQATPTL